MATILTAGVVLGIMALAISLLMWVHKRDQKRAAGKTNIE